MPLLSFFKHIRNVFNNVLSIGITYSRSYYLVFLQRSFLFRFAPVLTRSTVSLRMYARCTPVYRMLRRHDVRLRYISWKCTSACALSVLLLAHVRACAVCIRIARPWSAWTFVHGTTPAVVRFTTAKPTCIRRIHARVTRTCSSTQSRAHSRESMRTRARSSAVEHRTQCRKSVAWPMPVPASRPSDFDAGARQQQVTRSFLGTTSTSMIVLPRFYSIFSFSWLISSLFIERVTRDKESDTQGFRELKNGWLRVNGSVGRKKLKSDPGWNVSVVGESIIVVLTYERWATVCFVQRMHWHRREVINGVVCEAVAFSGWISYIFFDDASNRRYKNSIVMTWVSGWRQLSRLLSSLFIAT